MKKLEISQMENLQGASYACKFFTGAMCTSTVILAFSGVFAPLAGGTGFACATGLASGCPD